jgi:hypothetical protein
MKTRRNFIKMGVSALGLAVLPGASRGHEQSTIPPRPSIPAEQLSGWQRVATPKISDGNVTMATTVHSKASSAQKLEPQIDTDLQPFAFFAATLRYTGSDGGDHLNGASVSVPLAFGASIRLPVSMVRSWLDFAAISIPESVERRARDAFAANLEREQPLDSLETAFGDFPGSETYNKSKYQTVTEAYKGEWDGDDVVETIDFEGVLSVETVGTGTDFPAVGGIYPDEDSVMTAATDWPEFNLEARRTELKNLMRATGLPTVSNGGA